MKKNPSVLTAASPSLPRMFAAFLSLFVFSLVLWTFADAAFAQVTPGTEEPQTVLDALVQSGIIGLVIIICSIIGVSLAISFAFQIRHDVMVPPELLGQLEQLFEEEDYEEAYHVCEANPSFLGVVISAGLAKLEEGYEEMQKAMFEAGEIETTKYHQRVGYLSLIANLAPMLGLLGTVLGMIMTFNEIANSPVQPKPRDLAQGISVALGTTFLGLTVAIPMTVLYVFFRNRVINVAVEVGAIAEELMSRFKPRS